MEDERRMKHNFTLARLCQNNLMVLFDSCCISEKCVGFVVFFSFFFSSLKHKPCTIYQVLDFWYRKGSVYTIAKSTGAVSLGI